MTDISNIPKIDKQTRHPYYLNWISMKRRCYYKQDKDYHNYGGRGIEVCDRWLNNFSAFVFDMGEKPSAKHTLDRIENNKNYTPENCRWSTIRDQANNKRNNIFLTYRGETLTVPQWEQKLGLTRATIYQRLANNLPIEEVLENKRRGSEKILCEGKWLYVYELAKLYNIRMSAVRHRIKRGMIPLDAVTLPVLKRGKNVH